MTPTPQTAACIDLSALSAGRFKLSHDPAAVTPAERRDPWTQQLECRTGCVIHPHGGNRLAVEVDGHPHIARALRQLSGVTVHQHGDRELTLLFDAAQFEAVAEIVRPRRRRQVSEAERQRLAELSIRHSPFRNSISESGQRLVETPISPQDDPEHVRYHSGVPGAVRCS